MFGDAGVIIGLSASLAAAAMSTFGVITMSFFSAWAQRNSSYCSAFAVGLLSVGVMFHLIPEAASHSDLALSWVAGGFMFMVLVGIAVQAAVNRQPDGAALTFGYASIIALAIHSFFDGVVYAATFQKHAFTGWVATGGLLLHEFPEGVIGFALLARAGVERGRAIVIAVLAAAATTIAGTIGANLLMNLSTEPPLAPMLGAAAGALIYVLIVHLGPHATRTPGRRGYDWAMFGAALGTAAMIVQSLTGGHVH